jgi:cytochrome c biogenesis protein CcdA
MISRTEIKRKTLALERPAYFAFLFSAGFPVVFVIGEIIFNGISSLTVDTGIEALAKFAFVFVGMYALASFLKYRRKRIE